MTTDSTFGADVDADVAAPTRPASPLLVLIRRPAFLICLVDIALIVLFSLLSPNHVFFTVNNFSNMALDGSQAVLLAVGTAMLLGSGEIDVSLGANVVLSSIFGARATVALAGTATTTGTYPNLGLAVAAGIAVAVVTGVVFGFINGWLVARLRINSFITTLATLGIGTGLGLVLTRGSNVSGIPTQLQTYFGVYDIGGIIPAPAIVTVVAAIIIWFVLEKTRFGLRSLAIGSSREAAIRAGIKSRRIMIVLFCLGGAAAGLAAVMDYSRFSTTNVGGHTTDALQAVAGVVIGGGAIFGGKVSIPGAVFGALLAVILSTGLVILGLDPFYQQIAVGVVLLLAVYVRARSDKPTEQDEGRRRRTRTDRVRAQSIEPTNKGEK